MEAKKINNKYKIHKILIALLFVSTLLMGIGYAASTMLLEVDGTATVAISNTIEITNVILSSSNNANTANSTINSYFNTNLNSTIELNNASASSITYAVTVYNNTGVSKAFKDVTPPYTTQSNFYNNTGIKYEVTGIDRGEILQNQGSKTFYVTFSYANGVSQNKVLNSVLAFNFDNYYTITYVDFPGTNLPTVAFSGDNLTVTASTPPTSVTVTGTVGSDSYNSTTGVLTITNITSDITITGVTGGGGNISPEAEQVIENSDPGDTLPVTTETSTDPITIGTDNNGNITTGYDPNAQGGAKFYLLSTDYIGEYKKGNQNRPAETVTFSVENLTWQVWDRYDDKLILISTNPTSSTLSLINAVGYNNGIYFMESIVDSLYGGATGVTGRNLRMTDIEKKMMEYIDAQNGTHTYTDSTGQAIMTEANLIALRKQIDSTYASTSYTLSNSKYKNIPVSHGTASTVDFYNDTSVRILEEVGSGVPTTSGSTSRSTVVGTKLFYSATSLTNYLSSSDISMLNSNGTSYWIATRVMNSTAVNKSITFGYRRSNGTGGVTNSFFANSDTTTGVSVATYALRPVLEIDLTQVSVTLENGVLTFN